MEISSARDLAEQFFIRLSETSQRILLLDYDGTIAPFTPERDQARPYPEASKLLQRILRETDTKLVMVTGRPAWELRSLLPLNPVPEIWGCHGFERLLPSGDYQMAQADPKQLVGLIAARNTLASLNLHSRIENKPAGMALHWRGLAYQAANHARNLALRRWVPIAEQTGLHLTEFDGGLELRVSDCNKGNPVQHVLEESAGDSAVAYLGDDLTDEDAFQTLRPQDLAVLVREENRDTCARIWLKPPEELFQFFRSWLTACGGAL